MNAAMDTDQARYQRRCAHAVWMVTLVSAIMYAAVRYHVLQGVSWHEFPLWTMNKVFALTAMALAAMAAIAGIGRQRLAILAGDLWRMVTWFVMVHVLLSVTLLSPDRYPWFYVVVTGNGTALHGITAIAMLLSILAVVSLMLRRGRRLETFHTIMVLLLSSIHIALLGFSLWFNQFTWPAGLPPVSLVAVVAGAVALLAVSISVIRSWIAPVSPRAS